MIRKKKINVNTQKGRLLELLCYEHLTSYYPLAYTSDNKISIEMRVQSCLYDLRQSYTEKELNDIFDGSDSLFYELKRIFSNIDIKGIYWTGRFPSKMKEIIEKELNYTFLENKLNKNKFKNNPSDIMIQTQSGLFFGISIKYQESNKKTTHKNVGTQEIIKKYGLTEENTILSHLRNIYNLFEMDQCTTVKQRKKLFRTKYFFYKKEIDLCADEYLNTLRDELFHKFDYVLTNKGKSDFIKEYILKDIENPIFPYMIAQIKNGNVLIHSDDATDILNKIDKGLVNFQPSGNNCILIIDNITNQTLLKLRFKYESQKLASSIKINVEY